MASWADEMDRAQCICGHVLDEHDPNTMTCAIDGCLCAGFDEDDGR